MKVELFDFKKGKWNFDWSQLPEPVEPAPMPKHEARELDLVDIGILVALETDATQSLKDIAKQLKVSYKTVLRHFGHVESQGLFACYKVIYTKTQLNPETGNLGRTSHRYLGYEVRVNDVTRHELVELSSSLNRLPYLWGEEGGTNYSAEMVVPLEMVNETLDFVRKVLRPYPGRSATYVIDPRCSLVFAVPVLFDDKKKKWKFGMEDQIDSLRGVLEKVKSDRKASS